MIKKIIDSFTGKYGFLSNFYKNVLVIDGISYSTLEHAFQSVKTLSIFEKRKIANKNTAKKAKIYGQTVKLRKGWEKIKIRVMKKLLVRKFKNENLRNKLLETGNKILIEGNYWHDNFWGNCMCESCCDTGRNELGNLLMDVRQKIKKEEL